MHGQSEPEVEIRAFCECMLCAMLWNERDVNVINVFASLIVFRLRASGDGSRVISKFICASVNGELFFKAVCNVRRPADPICRMPAFQTCYVIRVLLM